jgi:hypothetical protein
VHTFLNVEAKYFFERIAIERKTFKNEESSTYSEIKAAWLRRKNVKNCSMNLPRRCLDNEEVYFIDIVMFLSKYTGP